METDAPEAAQPISYSIGYAPDDNYALVEGQICSPDVATVEARFDSGPWLQDSGEDDRFTIVAAGADRLCEIRVLNEQGEVIFRDSGSNDCDSAAAD